MAAPATSAKTVIVDVARPARAHDGRAAPLALFRAMLLTGLFLTLAALAVGYIEAAILGVFALVFGAGFMLLVYKTRFVVLHAIAVLLLGVYGGLFLLEAALTATRPPSITAILDLKPYFDRWIAEAEAAADTSAWRTAQGVVAVVMAALGFALLRQALRLAALGRRARRVLNEPATPLQMLFDLKPGVGRYMAGAPLSLIAALLGSLIFSLAAANIALVAFVHNSGMLNRVAQCGETVPDEVGACFAAFGTSAAIGLSLMLAFSAFVFPLLGGLLMRRARRASAKTAAARLETDRRPPLLFLRSFVNDQVETRPARPGPLGFALTGLRGRTPLDHLLVEDFIRYAPPRALGRPEERDAGYRPFGSLRIYVENEDGPDPAWRREVARLADEARAIIMVFDERIENRERGVGWELGAIGNRPDWRERTLFLAHDSLARRRRGERRADFLARNRNYWGLASELSGFPLPETRRPILGLAFVNGVATVATVGRPATTSDYLVAMRVLIEPVIEGARETA